MLWKRAFIKKKYLSSQTEICKNNMYMDNSNKNYL